MTYVWKVHNAIHFGINKQRGCEAHAAFESKWKDKIHMESYLLSISLSILIINARIKNPAEG